jgi:hypothetical protein
MPGIELILDGVDVTGPHIYKIDNGNAYCCDSVGFAAIGIGAWHANSQLMLNGYSPLFPVAESILSVYMAKRRSEVAPGVGVETDMFALGPELGRLNLSIENDPATNKLKEVYENLKTDEKIALGKARVSTDKFIQDFINENQAKPDQEIKKDKPEPPPTDGTSIPDSPKKR